MPIFVGFSNRRFRFSKRLVCYIKRRKIVFSQFILTISDMGIQGLEGVTGGYRGLQEVTGGYKGLQGVRGGYRRLQGVTRGYRG